MNDVYRFGGGEERKVFGPLPPGDYPFTVTQCGEPYQKQNGNWVLQVRLRIEPTDQTVFATPWSGTTRDGEQRDGVGDFLLCVNRAPELGEEPDWRRVEGARGRCRLKIETAQQGSLAGKEVNKVAFFHHPKEIKQAEQHLPPKVQEMKREVEREPDDIPF